MVVKVLWIAVAVIWGLNLVLSCISRSKAKKAAMAAATAPEAADADADAVSDET